MYRSVGYSHFADNDAAHDSINGDQGNVQVFCIMIEFLDLINMVALITFTARSTYVELSKKHPIKALLSSAIDNDPGIAADPV